MVVGFKCVVLWRDWAKGKKLERSSSNSKKYYKFFCSFSLGSRVLQQQLGRMGVWKDGEERWRRKKLREMCASLIMI